MKYRSQASLSLLPLVFSLVLVACTTDPVDPQPDAAATEPDTTTEPETTAPDAVHEDDASPDDVATSDDADPRPPDADDEDDLLYEQEPNDGQTDGEFNALPVGAVMVGNIDLDDVDIFHFDASPGDVYRIELDTMGSDVEPHLTVLDAGRGDKAAGEDFVKIVRTPETALDLLAMGEGGYLVIDHRAGAERQHCRRHCSYRH
ncbi:MAG: hypothetical protein ACNA8W_21545 [Bradymonadaceae bacterium]